MQDSQCTSRSPDLSETGSAASAGSDLAKIMAIIAVGMPASLLVTAWVAVAIRSAVRTEMEEQPTPKRLPSFNKFHYAGWGARIPRVPN